VRLFAALEVPADIRTNLEKLVNSLREIDSRPKWVRMVNLHVTLKFIGEVPEAKLDAIRAALAEVKSASAVELTFRGLGFFPNEQRPRVFWAGIDASPNLKEIGKEIEAVLEKAGIPRESREFSPHLTLARFEPGRVSEELRAAIENRAKEQFGQFRINRFQLMESKLKPAGAEHTALQSFAFDSEA
jgi:2'-5' RNA ligase